MGKSKKWIKPRHRIVRNVVFPFFYIFARIKYGFRPKRLPLKDIRQFLILYNHQTPFDQFFVGMTIRKPIYYLASEDIFSKGIISTMLRFLIAPIPIKKSTGDVRAVMNCIKVAREGGTIAIAPEGNRTYSGKTEYINPSISNLAKKLSLPIAFVKIEGGYGVQPRWSDSIRKGNVRTCVSRIIEPDEYKDLPSEELTKIIRGELYVNEANAERVYKSKAPASYLERAIYYCPKCGLSEFKSDKTNIKCQKCGLTAEYLPTTELKFSDPRIDFRFVNDWYEAQNAFVSSLDLSKFTETPMYKETADVYEVIVYKNKKLLSKKADISLYGDRIIIGENEYLFNDITAAAALGRNKVNFYHGGRVYQLKGEKSFNALKYVNIYYLSKNVDKEYENGKFLGL